MKFLPIELPLDRTGFHRSFSFHIGVLRAKTFKFGMLSFTLSRLLNAQEKICARTHTST